MGIIKVRYTNLFRYPAPGGNIVACVVRGTPVEILDDEEEFYKVKFCNDQAYVNKRYVKVCGAEKGEENRE